MNTRLPSSDAVAEAQETLAALADRPYHPAERKGVSAADCERACDKIIHSPWYVSASTKLRVIRPSRKLSRSCCGERMLWVRAWIGANSCTCKHCGMWSRGGWYVCVCADCTQVDYYMGFP